MDEAFKTGMSFGLTSAVITTLGLIVGLSAGTNSRMIVAGGILIIAVADALSDAFGIHLSEEARKGHTQKSVWISTASTFLFKLVFALTFLIPVLLLELQTAVVASIIWGMIILGGLSYYLAKKEKSKPWKVITEHLAIAVFVVVVTNYLGAWVGSFA